jgi:hypothetical protein
MKNELTKAGGFCATNFGESLEVKRKGRAPTASQAATGKKCKKVKNKPKNSPKILLMMMTKKAKKNVPKKNHPLKQKNKNRMG